MWKGDLGWSCVILLTQSLQMRTAYLTILLAHEPGLGSGKDALTVILWQTGVFIGWEENTGKEWRRGQAVVRFVLWWPSCHLPKRLDRNSVRRAHPHDSSFGNVLTRLAVWGTIDIDPSHIIYPT